MAIVFITVVKLQPTKARLVTTKPPQLLPESTQAGGEVNRNCSSIITQRQWLAPSTKAVRYKAILVRILSSIICLPVENQAEHYIHLLSLFLRTAIVVPATMLSRPLQHPAPHQSLNHPARDHVLITAGSVTVLVAARSARIDLSWKLERPAQHVVSTIICQKCIMTRVLNSYWYTLCTK